MTPGEVRPWLRGWCVRSWRCRCCEEWLGVDFATASAGVAITMTGLSAQTVDGQGRGLVSLSFVAYGPSAE